MNTTNNQGNKEKRKCKEIREDSRNTTTTNSSSKQYTASPYTSNKSSRNNHTCHICWAHGGTENSVKWCTQNTVNPSKTPDDNSPAPQVARLQGSMLPAASLPVVLVSNHNPWHPLSLRGGGGGGEREREKRGYFNFCLPHFTYIVKVR